MKGADYNNIDMAVANKKKDFRVMDLANFRQNSTNSLSFTVANNEN